MSSNVQLVNQDNSQSDAVKPLVPGQVESEEATNEHRNTDGSAAGFNSSPDLDEQPLLVLDSLSSVLEHIKGSIIFANNEYQLVNDPPEHDWQKLQAYAKAVKELNISEDNEKTQKITDVLYYRLGQLQGISPLFPSLRRLRITSGVTSTSLPHLFLFFSPSLQEVELTGLTIIAQPTLTAFLRFTAMQTSLTTLILNSISLTQQVVDLIAGCSSLEALELLNVREEWPESSFEIIALLPLLKRLKINATKIIKTGGARTPGSLRCTSPVENLYFEGLASMVDVLASGLVDMPNLSTLHLQITRSQSELSHVLNIFKQFTKCGDAEGIKLTSVTVAFHNGNSLSRGQCDVSLPFNHLAVFSALHNLEYFEMSGIEMDEMNRLPSELGQHWRKIKTLRLPQTNQSCLPLSGVVALARFCPQLSQLRVPVEIPFDLSVFPAVSRENVLSHSLVTLSVGSPANTTTTAKNNIRRLDSVARWLYATFPNLRRIETCKGYQDKFWTDVGRLVKLCQAAVEFSDIRAATRPASLEG